MKTYGGIVVPNNADWNQIEYLMKTIQAFRLHAIATNHFDEYAEKDQLWKVIAEVHSRAEHQPQETADRELIRSFLKNVKLKHFFVHSKKEDLLKNTYKLIKRLENFGTAYLSVDADLFDSVILNGEELNWNSKNSFFSHAVALVGYSVAKNVFFIKDSNPPYLIEMSPQNLFLSARYAVQLVPLR